MIVATSSGSALRMRSALRTPLLLRDLSSDRLYSSRCCSSVTLPRPIDACISATSCAWHWFTTSSAAFHYLRSAAASVLSPGALQRPGTPGPPGPSSRTDRFGHGSLTAALARKAASVHRALLASVLRSAPPLRHRSWPASPSSRSIATCSTACRLAGRHCGLRSFLPTAGPGLSALVPGCLPLPPPLHYLWLCLDCRLGSCSVDSAASCALTWGPPFLWPSSSGLPPPSCGVRAARGRFLWIRSSLSGCSSLPARLCGACSCRCFAPSSPRPHAPAWSPGPRRLAALLAPPLFLRALTPLAPFLRSSWCCGRLCLPRRLASWSDCF